ncbi:amidohydrolase [Geodermatophilus sp. URMC 61]|uniref:amidohydrolase n=1 Tax=Geodermatophilus sp. URMC 61 TaxID=3423411 RepID=UPI00406C4F72
MLDLLLRDVRVITVDDARPTASVVGVLGGRVVGLDEEVRDLPARTVVDGDGAVVVPGFGDAHNHMAWFGQSLGEIDLSAAGTLGAVEEAVTRGSAGLPADAWVVGSGYDDTVIGAHPDRRLLDRAGGGRPVWLKHRSGHMSVVSSEVLRRSGVLDGRADAPEGGIVVRDAAGEPTGLLQERAQRLVDDLVKPYPVDDVATALGRASEVYAAEGLTHVVEAGIGLGLLGRTPVEAAAYLLARDRGLLRTRVELMVASDTLHPLRAHADDGIDVGLDLGLRTGFGDDRLRLGPMKIWLDGSLIGRTAALSEPFCDHGTAVLQDDPELMRRRMIDAHRAGWRVAAHAIGDDAVDLALDTFAEAARLHPRDDVRHRIEHAGVVRPDQLARFAELGVVPVPQARFLHAVGDTMAAAVGPRRADWLYRHRSFLDAGLRVPGSSDRPVAPGAPLLGMQSMVERRSSGGAVIGPDERVSAAQALRAYTLDEAWASHDERTRGSVTRGKHADLVLLDDDPLRVDPDRIGAIGVVATLVAGTPVHDTGLFAGRDPSPLPHTRGTQA